MLGRPTRLVIIGGGVVGLALFRKFSLGGLSPLLLESGADILSGASKANSAILHTGFDAPKNSLELECIKAGRAEYLEIHKPLQLPVLKSGALLVAWNEEEAEKLPLFVQKAAENEISDLSLISPEELRKREPFLSPSAVGAISIPGEYIIDPWSSPLAYAWEGLAQGGNIRRQCKVLGGDFKEGAWHLDTSQGSISTDWIINAAGLYGDIIETMARPSPFHIRPRKGQFAVFDKAAQGLLNAILLPVPSERTKGIVITRTIFGNILVGPTAEDQEDRDIAATDPQTIKTLIAKGRELIPNLAKYEQTALYAGLRPATQFKDYQIDFLKEKQWISIAGIRSTGLSAALGIATYVSGLWKQIIGEWMERSAVHPSMPNLSAYAPRPYQGKAGGDIICHCEWVTAKEVQDAFLSPLPPQDLNGLKRRTRATMGRCQGFYCAARLTSLLNETNHA